MTPAELIALAEKHNILIPNAFDKDSFEETSGWTDKKWERFINYYGYDENDDAIMESIEYFEEQDEEEEEGRTHFRQLNTEEKKEEVKRLMEEGDKIRCDCCDYSISKSDFDAGKGRIMFSNIGEHGYEYKCGICDDRCDEEGELIEVDEEEEKADQEEEEKEKKVIVDPEKVWLIIDALERDLGLEPDGTSLFLIHGIPFDNIIVRGLTDRQLEVLGRFVSRCKKSD